MTLLVRRRWVLPTTAVLTALVAMGWCAPSTALASCGDYVTTTSSSHGSPARHDMPPPAPQAIPPAKFDEGRQFIGRRALTQRLGDVSVPREHPPAAPCKQCPSPPGQPCQGPWCSENHLPLPVPTTVEQVDDHWACCQSNAAREAREPINLQLLQDQQHRVHHVFPIFHPPRPI